MVKFIKGGLPVYLGGKVLFKVLLSMTQAVGLGEED
jgi:hypothetical protein